MSIRAYGKNGDPLEKRDFGSILSPNHATIQFLESIGCPVKRFTVMEAWWGESRLRGIYKIGTATAEVGRGTDRQPTGEVYISIQIECTKIEDGTELYMLIRSGKILPSTSYEEKQINTPAYQFRDLVRIWWSSVITNIRSRLAT